MKNRKIRFILIGFGYRSNYFYRVAKYLPELFEITAIVVRRPEQAQQITHDLSIFATTDLNQALETDPSFAILSTPREITFDYLNRLMALKVPVLSETPPAQSIEALNELWTAQQTYQGQVQVCEQYFLQPLYGAWINAITQGMIGEPINVNLSALHGYHGVSIFRKLLNLGYENCEITGKRFNYNITKTSTRAGLEFEARQEKTSRDVVTFEFDNGKNAFFDFSSELYFSQIWTRKLTVQGVRGEIDDLTIRYLNQDNIPIQSELNRVDRGLYNNREWSHQRMTLGDRVLYETPFPTARLNDDELAIATCMQLMQHYVETGEPFYDLREGLQDTYLSFMMEEALKTPYQTLTTKTQTWAE